MIKAQQEKSGLYGNVPIIGNTGRKSLKTLYATGIRLGS
jgi:hypothetical protein